MTDELTNRWNNAWETVCGALPPPQLYELLINRYNEPQRAYHTLVHLKECFAWLEHVRPLAQRPAELELALWFHDAIYNPRHADNEIQSAMLAAAAAQKAGAAQETVHRIHELIMATTHDGRAKTDDELLICDIDLAILGAAPDRFEIYEQQIRAEYRHVPRMIYRRKRAAVLQTFVDRPAIYASQFFSGRCELQARSNLQQSIRRLRPVVAWFREMKTAVSSLISSDNRAL